MTENRTKLLLRSLPTTDPVEMAYSIVEMAYIIAKLEEEIEYYREKIQILTDRDVHRSDRDEKLVNCILEEKYIPGYGFTDSDKDLMKDAGISEIIMNAFVEDKKAEEAKPKKDIRKEFEND